ncbi:hypothetical protein GGS20DRAFT_595078 [Poronia punctata]|nr:hypothetical protein GGS20DRAFT_595078 [Poronia punctata]
MPWCEFGYKRGVEYNLPIPGDLEAICNAHTEDHSTPATTFPKFSLLAREVQMMIWEFAMAPQQIASLTVESTGQLSEDIEAGRIPRFLFVNWQAYKIAMRRYPIRFSFRYCEKANDEVRRIFRCGDVCDCNSAIQNCRIGPDDIVALRIEKYMYAAWDHNWSFWYMSSWQSEKPEMEGDMLRSAVYPYFHGTWLGNYRDIKNWMVPAPLNMFHLAKDDERELSELKTEPLEISMWYQDLFKTILGDHEDVPKKFENVYCLGYGWREPQRKNLTFYDLEDADERFPNFAEAGRRCEPDGGVPGPQYKFIRGDEVIRHADNDAVDFGVFRDNGPEYMEALVFFSGEGERATDDYSIFSADGPTVLQGWHEWDPPEEPDWDNMLLDHCEDCACPHCHHWYCCGGEADWRTWGLGIL